MPRNGTTSYGVLGIYLDYSRTKNLPSLRDWPIAALLTLGLLAAS